MDRTKYMQSGTGQVGYLSATDQGVWAFEVFVGGPAPYQPVAEWESREEAEQWLEEQGFRPESD